MGIDALKNKYNTFKAAENTEENVLKLADVIVSMYQIGRDELKYELGKQIKVFKKNEQMKRIVNHRNYESALKENTTTLVPDKLRNTFVCYAYSSKRSQKDKHRARIGNFQLLNISDITVSFDCW